MKPISLLFYMLLATHISWGSVATGKITGQITDENSRPLFGVNVGFTGTTRGTSTDANGKFSMEGIPVGSHILLASMIGHEPFRQEVNINPGKYVQLEIVLPSQARTIPQVSVIADRGGIFERVPGALSYISAQDILQADPVSGNEILRRSPGVHVVDEEGLGLRANIGIRGLDPSRSRSVLVMEDGIPVALAPYGEPEMYYTPAMERMSGVEILKGSGSIMYGPQTIGGVVNYITPDPPLEASGNAAIRGAQGGYFQGMFSYGNTHDNTGFRVNYLHKQADSVGTSQFSLHELSFNMRTHFNNRSNLGIKLGVYDESSNSTYVGLTQTMYDAGGSYDFIRMAPDDHLHIRRYSIAASHNHFLTHQTRITSSVYAYTTSRNWQRQDFAYNAFGSNGELLPKPSNFTGIVWGDETLPGGAIYMRDGTGNRNRQFEVAGIESKINIPWSPGTASGELTAGFRLLYERAYEQRVNGQRFNASSGFIQDDEIRTGHGSSAFAHYKVSVSQRISLSGGVRVEHFAYERDIRRGRFRINTQTEVRDTLLVAGSSTMAIIPGIGSNVTLGQTATIFGGIHRGYAPPRVKDAVSGTGEVYQLDAEESWNLELGIRQRTNRTTAWEVTLFHMDFSNQVIPVAESAGGLGSGLVNGGSTIHRGVEASASTDLTQITNSTNYSLMWDVGITWVDAYFQDDRFVAHGEETVNIRGHKTPYAPQWLIQSALCFNHNMGLMARLSVNHAGAQFADVLNTIEPAPDGRSGIIPAYTVFNLNLAYELPVWRTRISLSVKNLTNERYMVSRRPQGVRLGLPRMFTLGLSTTF